MFRFDLTTDELVRMNVAGDGTPADGDSGGVPLSADGRYVLFGHQRADRRLPLAAPLTGSPWCGPDPGPH